MQNNVQTIYFVARRNSCVSDIYVYMLIMDKERSIGKDTTNLQVIYHHCPVHDTF